MLKAPWTFLVAQVLRSKTRSLTKNNTTMKTKSIGARSTQPAGYVNQYGQVVLTAGKSFAQLCKEAAEEREQIYG